MTSPVAGILQRTLVNIRNAWRSISQSARVGDVPRLRADLPDKDAETLRRLMRECLESKGGEVSGRARAAALGQSYMDLNDLGRKRFLHILAYDFGVDWKALVATAGEIRENDDRASALEIEERLRTVLTPSRLKLLTQFNSLPSGVKFLVDLRADLRRFQGSDPSMRSLERDLKGLLASWFDVGFLNLERIAWESPAALLERLIAYEAVHEIQSWDDLKNRLGEDRRCYAFFHPRMPTEPLIFVEVALVSGMSDSIQALLGERDARRDPATANAAIFYSISNTQKGLKGVNLGTFLIKRVVDRLVSELPNLRTFATLSPVPDFGRYMSVRVRDVDGLRLTPAEHEALEGAIRAANNESLADLLQSANWHRDPRAANALKGPLMRLCAEFLLYEREDGCAVDRVGNFHLNNGARLERVNWLADVSEKGMRRSAGLMVNYRYELDDIARNHEAYHTSGDATASKAVLGLLLPEEEAPPGKSDVQLG